MRTIIHFWFYIIEETQTYIKTTIEVIQNNRIEQISTRCFHFNQLKKRKVDHLLLYRPIIQFLVITEAFRY